MILTSCLNMEDKTVWLLGENVGDYLHDMEEKIFLTGYIKEKEW